jgi:N-acetylmuramoyl-L-alanine amidase CwlD
MKPLPGKAGSPMRRRSLLTLALTLGLALGLCLPGRAQTLLPANNFWFGGTQLAFEHAQSRYGQLAVATDDGGLGRFLAKLGAVLSYQPGQNSIVVTSSDRRVVSFTLGDPHFSVAGVEQMAAFAPFASGGVAYVPFLDLARALYVDPVQDGATVVLQPQLASLEVRPQNRMTLVTLRGASPLRFKRLSGPGDEDLLLAFLGTASTLQAQRDISAAGLKSVTIRVDGTARNPTTVVDFSTASGGVRVLGPSDSPNAITLAFAAAGVALGGTPIPPAGNAALATAPLLAGDQVAGTGPGVTAVTATGAAPPAPTLPPYGDQSANDNPATTSSGAPLESPTPTAYGLAPATIGALDTQSTGDGFNVNLSITGDVTYEWHRLPDNRWYVDFKPATLAVPAQDRPLEDPSVLSLRVKPFIGPNDRLATVRIALTLASPRTIGLIPTSDGLTIAVGGQDDTSDQKVGMGELLPGRLYTGIVPLPPVEAAPEQSMPGPDESWKFGSSVPTNPRLIVIDPGHGGSDTGAEHNGLVEKDLNLDFAKRLRAILLARGWQVKMTRDDDVDVFGPNASAHDELQARCDVANKAGARMFVSVHSNSFTTSELSGTTTYYYKANSYALADAVHARLTAVLPTKDDGIRKDNFYVIHHSTMPAILVETAFLSNPGDAALLKTTAFRQRVAEGIADGIGDYASANPQPSDSSTMDGN